MRSVIYTAKAAKELRKYREMAGRIRKVLGEFAADPTAHANNVTQLVGSTAWRLRVGDYRVIFELSATTILVTKIAPRGSAY